MKTLLPKFTVSSYSLIIVAVIAVCAPVAQAQLPVTDALNLVVNTLSSVGNTTTATASTTTAAAATTTAANSSSSLAQQGLQYAKQLSQYATQLNQYTTEANTLATEGEQLKNMVQNTASLGSFNFANPQSVISSVQGVGQQFSGVASGAGGLSSYLGSLKNLEQYRQMLAGGLTPSAVSTMSNNQVTLSAAEQAANADAQNTVQQQQGALQSDAARIAQLEAAVQGSTGQQQTAMANGQLLGEVADQLQQLRASQLTGVNAQTTAAQQQADQIAAQKAAADAISQPLPHNDPPISMNPF